MSPRVRWDRGTGGTASAALMGPAVTRMFVGMLTLDLLLGEVHSLKEKRAVVRPIVAELARRYSVAVGEVGDADLHRRAVIGLATVSGESGQCVSVLDACERLVAARPEVDLLSARRRVVSEEDE